MASILAAANNSGLSPAEVAAFTEAPASRSKNAISKAPERAANINGVNSPRDCVLTLAPASINALATSIFFADAAHINAVCPLSKSFSLGLAPASSNFKTAEVLPVREQLIRDVSPLGSRVCESAPLVKSRLTISLLPLRQAIEIGATPNSLVTLALAPASNNCLARLT